ncbi:MAG: hypothetical protein JWN70_2885 [Planctomycetaceae bacterium]|nr:hypothetical protein [Planctomycetaceae bacterium]
MITTQSNSLHNVRLSRLFGAEGDLHCSVSQDLRSVRHVMSLMISGDA